MSIQIKLNICRSCLTEGTKTTLTELPADSDSMKSFQYLTNSELAVSSSQLPTTFCQKCIAKIKIGAAFKKLSLESEKYLVNLVNRINQDLKNSLSSINEHRQSAGSEEKASNDDEDQEFEFLLEENQIPKVESKDPDGSATITAIDTKIVKSPKKVVYEETETMLDGDIIFTDDNKEMYDIMEIEGNDDNIYVDEAGTIINPEDEGDEFILVNYKSESDSAERSEYVVQEEGGDDDQSYEIQQNVKKPRQRHVEKLPREIVDRFARTTDSNQHMCTKCVKVFSSRTNLIRHIQSHDGNKPYVCKICNKGFTQSGSLKQHIYTHTGEKPYKCEHCDKAFTQSKSLTFHMRRHQNIKPYVCSECNAEFRQRDGLKRHLKTRHNIELKYDRNLERPSQGCSKIIAFVEMKEETDGKAIEILEETSEGTDDKKQEEF